MRSLINCTEEPYRAGSGVPRMYVIILVCQAGFTRINHGWDSTDHSEECYKKQILSSPARLSWSDIQVHRRMEG